jgi:serine/threonine protein kinase
MILEKIDRFEIKRILGKGGLAIVYLAYDTTLGRNVAIKIPTVDAQKKSGIERFFREARVVADLEIPYVVPVYDFFPEHQPPFMVMKYMPGGSLRDHLDDGKIFTLKESIDILTPIADVLDKIHAKGRIHRDVKPSNILFDNEGVAHLSDFGCVLLLDEISDLTSGTEPGTYAYMSYEQLGGETTTVSDVYSFGVILYQMLTGKAPSISFYDRVHEEIEEITSLGQVREVLLKVLAKNPEDRYKSASDFTDALKAIITEELANLADSRMSQLPLRMQEAPDHGFPILRGYNIVREIGRGGVGIVYLATDPNFYNREVAIKVPQENIPRDRLDSFFKEANLAAKLGGARGIVPVYANKSKEDPPFIVMQYMSGGSLEDRLKSRTSLSLSEIIDVLQPISTSLDRVHSKGIYHQDIKPSNILFDEEGEAYLGDFGCAKIKDAPIGKIRDNYSQPGSKLYMSPEQLAGKPVASSDIYQLGVILFQMLTGEKPVPNLYKKISKFLNQTELSPSLTDVLSKALAKSPEDRYQTATDLVEDLIHSTQSTEPPKHTLSLRSVLVRVLLIIILGFAAYFAIINIFPNTETSQIMPPASEPEVPSLAFSPPCSSHLAFSSNHEGNYEVYIIDPNHPTDILWQTDHPAVDEDPAWSPQGNKLAFQSNRYGQYDIFLVDLASGELLNLTKGSFEYAVSPSWSPSGEQIVFAAKEVEEDWDIYTIDSIGGLATNLTKEFDADDQGPDWSWENNLIAFDSNRQDKSDTDIYIMDSDGNEVSLVSQNPFNEYNPSWSPDGNELLFYAQVDDKQVVYRLTLGDSYASLVEIRSSSTHPAWTPDDNKILVSFEVPGTENRNIYHVYLDGTSVPSPITSFEGKAYWPSWCPLDF